MAEPATGDIAQPTFESVFEAAETASPAVVPETPAPDVETPAAATAQPTPETPESPDTPSASAGPIPFERHKAILENTRTKTRAEVEAEWQPHAWAKEVPREKLEQAVTFAQQVSSNPRAFWATLTQELLGHPEHGQALRSELARVLGSARGRPAAEEPEPQPDLQAEDGRLVYSADQARKLLTWRDRDAQRTFDARLAERLQPFEQMRQRQEKRDQEDQQREDERTASESAASQIADMESDWPWFKEQAHKHAVGQVMTEHEDWSFERAALYVLKTVILPTMKGTDQQAVLNDLKRKAAATSLNPGEAAPVTPTRPKDFYEALGVER